MRENENHAANGAKPERKTNKHMRTLTAVMTVLFMTLLVGTSVLLLALPKKEMSETENRVLAKPPVLSLETLADGSFMKNFETYLSDHFPFRDKVIKAKTTVDRAFGKKEENGVYIGKNGFLFEKQTDYDSEKVNKNLKAMNAFAKKHKNISSTALIAPNSSYVLSDLLPAGISFEDQSKQLEKIEKALEKINFVNCCKTFSTQKDKEQLYYRTDHHWTTRAAKLAFNQLVKVWKADVKDIKYSFTTVTNDFQGTLSSSSAVTSSKDKIEICTPDKEHNSYIVFYESSAEKTASLFKGDRLRQKNKYEVFAGGNFDKLVITTAAKNSRSILIFKDSYVNCMLPMLTPLFSEIVVIDPRYYSDSLEKLMQEYSFTDILFLYNLNTFLADTSLADTLES